MSELAKGLVWIGVIAVGFYIGGRLILRFPGGMAQSDG
jgi:hypothetical protein